MKNKRKIVSSFMVFLLVFTSVVGRVNFDVKAKTSDDISNIKEMYKQQLNDFKSNEEVNVIIQLDEKAAKDYNQLLTLKEAANDKVIMDKVLKSQQTYKKKIQKIDEEVIFGRNYYILLNGFSVKTKYENIEKIKDIEGVKEITLEKIYTPKMSSAKAITNIKNVWEEYKYKGEGMVISVIDSGVDYTHKDMRISEGVEVKLTEEDVKAVGGKGKYFTKKIPYGYNFADDNYDIIDTGSMHGMHVAGISAANGVDKEVTAGEAIKGVAPEAQVLAMKVFSNSDYPFCSSEDVIAAIEESVALGADVINMSLGAKASFANGNDPEQIAVREASERGVICITAAGNDRYATKPYRIAAAPDSGVVDAPSVAKEAFSIASCENDEILTVTVEYNAGEESGDLIYTSHNNPVEVLKEKYELVECGLGRVPGSSEANPEANDFEGKDLTGKIALIQRGELTFGNKSLNAQKNGAVGVIIYNHEGGGDNVINMIGFSEEITVPVMFVYHSSGEKLKELIASNVKVSVSDELKRVQSPSKGNMSLFSAWGPTPSLDFKPEITAPGGRIWSTLNDNKYGLMDGTSMATPHTAGIMALVMQHMKTLDVKFKNGLEKVEFAKKLAMNTAVVKLDPATDKTVPFSPRRMGAGFIDAKAAIDNYVTVTHSSTGKAAVELKEVKDRITSFELVLTNYGKEDVKYTVKDRSGVLTEQQNAFINTISYDEKIEGAEVAFDKNEITVPAGKSVKVKAIITLPEELTTERFVEGFIGFESENENVPSLGIPYMGFYGAWDKPIITDLPAWNENTIWGETLLKSVDSLDEETTLGVVGQGEYGPVIDPAKIAMNGETKVTPQVTFFRNANKMYVNVLDKNHNVVRTIAMVDKFRKNVFEKEGKEETTSDEANWAWDGKLYNTANGRYEVAPEGQYYIEFKSVIDFEGAKYQSLKLPVKVDTTKGMIYQVRMSAKQIQFKAKDNYSGISAFAIKVNDEFHKDAEGNQILKLEADENGTYSVDLELMGGDEVAIYGIDYAGNIAKFEKEAEFTEDFKASIDWYSNRAETENGIFINSKNITVRGYVSAKTKVLKVMGKDVKVKDDLTFEASVELPKEGPNKVKLYAESEDGQVRNHAYGVVCDTKAPVIKLTAPYTKKDTSIVYVDSTAKYFRVEGSVMDNLAGYNLFINGDHVEGVELYANTNLDTLRRFSRAIELTGNVNTIEIKAVDAFENETVKKIVVIKY